MPVIFVGTAQIIFIFTSIWAILISVGVVFSEFGIVAGLISCFILPVTMLVVPLYTGLVLSNWSAVIVGYGGISVVLILLLATYMTNRFDNFSSNHDEQKAHKLMIIPHTLVALIFFYVGGSALSWLLFEILLMTIDAERLMLSPIYALAAGIHKAGSVLVSYGYGGFLAVYVTSRIFKKINSDSFCKKFIYIGSIFTTLIAISTIMGANEPPEKLSTGFVIAFCVALIVYLVPAIAGAIFGTKYGNKIFKMQKENAC